MKTILFCWETGENFGHLARDLPLAKQLRSLGHDVVFAVRDIQVARLILGPENFRFTQSPRLSGGVSNRPPATYAEILLSQGYFSAPILSALLKAWFHIFQEIKPSIIIANHAPTAVLAARCSSIPVVATCIGFELPPIATVPKSFRPHDAVPTDRLITSETLALGSINQVLESKGIASISHTSEIFSQASVMMTTFPELDHYGPRKQLEYVGLFSELRPSSYNWEPTKRRKVFCYLRAAYLYLDNVLMALEAIDCDALCIVPDAEDATLARYDKSTVRVQRETVSIKSTMDKADLIITYGTGTMHDALLAGKPILICPLNAEQFMVGTRIVSLGAGLILPNGTSVTAMHDVINLMCENQNYMRSAQGFAKKYIGFSSDDAVSRVIGSIQRLL